VGVALLRNGDRTIRGLLPLIMALIVLSGCTTPSAPGRSAAGASPPDQPGLQEPAARKTITIGIVVPFLAFSLADTQSGSGSGIQLQEIWLQGLVTSGNDSPAPQPRIAARLPSLEQGTMRIESDGRMVVTWQLRDDVRWADGQPVTAHDFAFGFQVQNDGRLSFARGALGRRVQAVTAQDERTLIMVWNEPYYLSGSVGTAPNALQPLPRHVLQDPYTNGPAEAFENHPYWTSDFFHVGPYRPTRFDPQSESVFEAVPHYFLGGPRVGTIVVRKLGDPNATYAALLAGAIDIAVSNAITPAIALELKERWTASGEGTVYIGAGVTQFVAPQFSPELQKEPALLDPIVRRGLYHAIDREAWADVVMGGKAAGAVATGLLPANHHLASHTQGSLATFTYDPRQAAALLMQAGWSRGSDGLLAHAGDGRRFSTLVWSTNENEATILADMWKQVGLDTTVYVMPRARQSDLQFWQSFPNVEVSSRGYGDTILERVDCALSPTAATSYAGDNRGHYCNRERMEPLLVQYRRSLTQAEQGAAIRRIADLIAEDLPILPVYFAITRIPVSRGVVAMQDYAGGAQGADMYGSFYRNAHLWDRTERTSP
jgi:peptide/nickel transport system substrate-binding protein